MSRLTLQLGQAGTVDDLALHARQAIALARTGLTLADGSATPAVRRLTSALDGYESWRARSRCFVSTDLAATHLNADEPDAALAAGRAAISAAAPIASVRTRERLRTLQAAAGSVAARSRCARDLHEELTHFLTEQARHVTQEPA